MRKRILALLVTALIMLTPFLPALADPAPAYDTPAGYNEHDYQKIVAFLEQTDADGVKNSLKLNPNYDPENVSTWYSPD